MGPRHRIPTPVAGLPRTPRVVVRRPGILGYRRDRGLDLGVHPDGDREAGPAARQAATNAALCNPESAQATVVPQYLEDGRLSL